MAFFKKKSAKSNADISEIKQSEDITFNEVSKSDDAIKGWESAYSECMDLMGAFSLKKDFFDSEMEKKVYDILKAFINEKFIIIPHVSLREVFQWDWSLSEKITNTVTKMHFDFGIYDTNLLPIMFVEVSGSEHIRNKKTKEADKFKKELLKKYDLKLVNIDVSKNIEEQELTSIVRQQIKQQIPSRDDYHVYCPNCHAAMYLVPNKKGIYFYSCSTYRPGNEINCRTCSVSQIAPLYHNIPVAKNAKK